MESQAERRVGALRRELDGLPQVEAGLVMRAGARQEIAQENEEVGLTGVREDALAERLDGALGAVLRREDAGRFAHLLRIRAPVHERLGQREALLAGFGSRERAIAKGERKRSIHARTLSTRARESNKKGPNHRARCIFFHARHARAPL